MAVENRLPLLLHLALPALLGSLHPLQHRVGSGPGWGRGCGQGASVLQWKEMVKKVKARQAPGKCKWQLGSGRNFYQKAIWGLSCPDEELNFQSSSMPALQLESWLPQQSPKKSPQERTAPSLNLCWESTARACREPRCKSCHPSETGTILAVVLGVLACAVAADVFLS